MEDAVCGRENGMIASVMLGRYPSLREDVQTELAGVHGKRRENRKRALFRSIGAEGRRLFPHLLEELQNGNN